jgi:FtsH-binding integral membrane protein
MWHIIVCILFVLVISGMVIWKTNSLKKKESTPLRTTTTAASIKGIFLWNKM